mmetsp:Transcript_5426/g.9082  ORF Transcript_5426/g.9082 Transcript_5426/m.9082 type:complete len:377 (+) Transcript_5426:94-1224(+)
MGDDPVKHEDDEKSEGKTTVKEIDLPGMEMMIKSSDGKDGTDFQIDPTFTLDEMMSRAMELEKEKQYRFACDYYLYCLEQSTSQNAFVICAKCLNRLAAICSNNGKYQAAVKYRHAEKLLYESSLLRELHLESITVDAKDSKDTSSGDEKTAMADLDGKEMPVDESEAPRKGAAATSATKSSASTASPPVTAKDVVPLKSDPQIKEAQARAFEKIAELFFTQNNKDMAQAYAMKAIRIRHKETELNTQYAKVSSDLTESFTAAKKMYSNALSAYERTARRRRFLHDIDETELSPVEDKKQKTLDSYSDEGKFTNENKSESVDKEEGSVSPFIERWLYVITFIVLIVAIIIAWGMRTFSSWTVFSHKVARWYAKYTR